ncbi:MAG: beta-propeller domain-containing protein, partial [Oscillospiraceae bacterium]|nr:beta-propeller domain-containing protein [Oscillospiraceae bacterium]
MGKTMKVTKKRLLSLKALLLSGAMMFMLSACHQSIDNKKQNDDKPSDNSSEDISRIADDYSEVFQMVKLANDERYGETYDYISASPSNRFTGAGIDDGRGDEVLEFDSDASFATQRGMSLPRGGGEAEEMGGELGNRSDFSDTNNQVEGVQESDIVKTDGNYIFIASNNYDYVYGGGSSGKVSVVKPDNG